MKGRPSVKRDPVEEKESETGRLVSLLMSGRIQLIERDDSTVKQLANKMTNKKGREDNGWPAVACNYWVRHLLVGSRRCCTYGDPNERRSIKSGIGIHAGARALSFGLASQKLALDTG